MSARSKVRVLHGRKLISSYVSSRLFVTTFWSAVSEGLSKGLMLVSLIAVARILGTGDYGEFGLIRTTISVFALLGGVGLGLTANKYVAQSRDQNKEFAGQVIGSSYVIAIVFGAIAASAIVASAGYLSVQVIGADHLDGPLRFAGLLLLLGAVNGAQIGMLQGLEAYRDLALGSLCQGLTAVLALTCGSYYFGLNGALAGLLLSGLVSAVTMHFLVRRQARRQGIVVQYTALGRMLPIFWRFSIPVALIGLAVGPFKWGVEAMLARSAGFAALGAFHAANNVATIFIAACSALNAPLISITSNQQARSGSQRLEYVNLYGSWYLFLILAAPCIVFPNLPALLFGQEYSGPTFEALTSMLLLYCGLLLYYQGIVRLITLRGSMWFAFCTNLFEGASLLLAFHFLADRGGIGLGLAYVCSYLVRIAISLPILLSQQIISRSLLLDKWFGLSLLVTALVTAMHLQRIP